LLVSTLSGAAYALIDDDPKTTADVVAVVGTINTVLISLGLWKSKDAAVKILLIALVPVFMIGCTTTSSKINETLYEYDADGNVTSKIETIGGSNARVGMMLKADRLAQDWSYEWGGDVNRIAFGANAAGYDSTKQAEVLQAAILAMVPAIEALAKAAAEAFVQGLAAPALPAAAAAPSATRILLNGMSVIP
jgi:hypothetical protein